MEITKYWDQKRWGGRQEGPNSFQPLGKEKESTKTEVQKWKLGAAKIVIRRESRTFRQQRQVAFTPKSAVPKGVPLEQREGLKSIGSSSTQAGRVRRKRRLDKSVRADIIFTISD